jgi:Clp amino terminal domain, pathogenicity island component
VVQRSEHAHRALELARAEAEGFGHRYLGPEHLVLGVQRHGDNGASQVLRSFGVDLVAARTALCHLADRGVVPGPRPSDAELLGSLGIDLAAIRRTTEQSLGAMAVGWAIREATRVRRRGVGRVPRTPLRDPPMLIGQVLYHAGEQARALGLGVVGAVAVGRGRRHPDTPAQVHEQPLAAATARLVRPGGRLPGRGRVAAGRTRG